MTEHVLVVPTSKIIESAHSRPDSGSPDALKARLYELYGHARYMARPLAEDDENYRQLIPYVAIVSEDQRVLTYHRPKKGLGDARIQGNRSIGFGGHVTQREDEPGTILFDCHNSKTSWAVNHAMWRELAEELKLPQLQRMHSNLERVSLRGLICLDGTPVDRVHFGLFHVWLLHGVPESYGFDPNPNEILDPQWVPIHDPALREDPKLESWSQYALDLLLAPRF